MRQRVVVGNRYGRLTVVTKLPNKARGTLWEALCDCGETITVKGEYLTSGTTKSCGCLRRSVISNLKSLNLAGKRFGRLIVTKRARTHITPNGTSFSLWEVLCDCGSIKIVKGFLLINGDTQSCGCLHKERVAKLKYKHGISHTKEYRKLKDLIRREEKQALDTKWTHEMERSLTIFQPSCVVCGKIDRLGTDHVLPLSLGYGLIPGNAVKLCQSCNSSKSNKLLDDLPLSWKNKIETAAQDFLYYWEKKT